MRRETHILFFRSLDQPIVDDPPLLAGAHGVWITDTADPHFLALADFYDRNGFGKQWVADMLQQRAAAIAALIPSPADPTKHIVCGAGWSTAENFYISEIRHTFYPSGHEYTFGDHVDPQYRGHRLQRWLLDQRVKRARDLGRGIIWGVVNEENQPSLKSCIAQDFKPVWQIKTWVLRWLLIDQIQRLSDLPDGKQRLSQEGARISPTLYLRRRYI